MALNPFEMPRDSIEAPCECGFKPIGAVRR
jgi:hypothetical protein